MISSEEILHKYWKHKHFRAQQKEIINSVLKGNDTIALLPTGGGKSLCYQVPAMQLDGVCLVISPLIALMKDQVTNLIAKGIKAVAITSELNLEDTIIAFDNLKHGSFKFLYLSPEKLQAPYILEKIKEINLNCIAIDEAHCISAWGHDFRPSYLKLNILKEHFSKIPFIALTATATKQVLADINNELQLNNSKLFQSSFYRKNIAFHVLKKEDTLLTLLKILKKYQHKPSIVFVNTRNKTQQIHKYLQKNKLQSSYYHGGLNATEKKNAFDHWIQEKTPIMVATNAFGMGIDKNNVATIIHLHVPNSIENYVQESGRAGRNGATANALILVNSATLIESKEILQKSLPDIPFIKQLYKHLNQYFQISNGELSTTNFPLDLHTFCLHYKIPIAKCYNGIKALENQELLIFNERMHTKSTVRFTVKNNSLLEYIETHPKKKNALQLLLRSYGGIFENNITINESYIAAKLNVTKKQLQITLQNLHKNGIIIYNKAINASQLQFLIPREDDRAIFAVQHHIKKINERKLAKIDAMLRFINEKNICRSKHLLAYFDETLKVECGVCDNCKNQLPKQNLTTKELVIKINALLNKNNLLTSKEIIELINNSEENILFALQLMLEKNIINLNSQHQFSSI